MAYPIRYQPQTNFPREEQLGNEISTASMQSEFARISESISQVITCQRRITTSDGRLKLDQAVRLNDVITEETHSGDGVTVTFAFDQEIDADVDLVRVWVNGVRTDPVSFTDSDFTMAVAPASGTDNIEVRIYLNIGGFVDRLQSVAQDEGASMVGIADGAAQFDADNVEDALVELATNLQDLITSLGNLGNYVLRDGTRTLTGQWEVNERSSVTIASAAAVGSLRVNTNPSDGNYVEINDGVLTVRFEFDNNSSVAVDAVIITIGATAEATAQTLTDAINNSPLAVKAEASGQNVALTHEIPYALGNQPIITSGAAITSVVGMAGGVDGLFSDAYKTHYRVRNHPRSLREGDVVVHEQLQDVYAQITASLTTFLRTDGANSMVAPLNMGGNTINNLADATLATQATSKAQVEALIAAAVALTLALNGTKTSPARGTLTGPVSLGRTSSETADSDQVADPSTVAVNTIHGVPTPAASDHVANKLYVDTQIALAIPAVDNGLPTFNIEGDGLGGGGLANINNGGDFYFNDLTIAAAQSLAVPVRLFIEGDLNLQNTGSITSAAPIEIIATGNVTLAGTVTCPFLSIRCGGSLTVSAAITTETNGTYRKAYNYEVGGRFGGPTGSSSAFTDAEINYWRAVIFDAVGTITISANITSDDIFITTNGNLTASSTFRARWWLKSSYNTQVASIAIPSWRDVAKSYTVTSGPSTTNKGTGGSGGTGGGTGGSNGNGVAGGASVWAAANRPYLFPTYELARGGMAAYSRTDVAGGQGRGGGRISVYAGGNMDLSAATFNANGDAFSDLAGGDNGGGGGGGTVRLACKGTMDDGSGSATGGAGDTGTAGGGGGVFTIASAYTGTQSRTAAAGANGGGGVGITAAVTLAADQIQGLKDRGIFGVYPDA